MDCRILRMLTLKANGHLVCDDSSGYGLLLGEVSANPGWNIRQVIDGPVYAHVRRSFAEGRPPWPGVCEGCHTFSPGGVALDSLGSRIRLMVEPTLACDLACPACLRKKEGRTRAGSWDLDPAIFEALLKSCAKSGIDIEEVHYLGWGEPLLYPGLAELTHLVRKWHPDCVQEATTSGSIVFQDFLEDVDLDKLTVSCDGVRQESYVRYRRQGQIEKVWTLFASLERFKKRPFVEWKYILFEHNDSNEDVALAQSLTETYGLDSLLFIITHSKWASQRYTVDTLRSFPLTTELATISPAAGISTIKRSARILSEISEMGHRDELSFFIDQIHVTVSEVLEIRGWSAVAGGGRIDDIVCYRGPQQLARTRPTEPRRDVAKAMPNMSDPMCGFTFRIPCETASHYNTLQFVVSFEGRESLFSMAFAFE